MENLAVDMPEEIVGGKVKRTRKPAKVAKNIWEDFTIDDGEVFLICFQTCNYRGQSLRLFPKFRDLNATIGKDAYRFYDHEANKPYTNITNSIGIQYNDVLSNTVLEVHGRENLVCLKLIGFERLFVVKGSQSSEQYFATPPRIMCFTSELLAKTKKYVTVIDKLNILYARENANHYEFSHMSIHSNSVAKAIANNEFKNAKSKTMQRVLKEWGKINTSIVEFHNIQKNRTKRVSARIKHLQNKIKKDWSNSIIRG